MKILLPLLALIFSTAASAENIKFKTLASARANGQFYIYCQGSDAGPELMVAFRQSISPSYSQTGGMALFEPGEGLLVRDWPYNNTYPEWSVGGSVTTVTITGTILTPVNQSINMAIQESTNGRFKGTFQYVGTGIQVNRAVTCRATNYSLVGQ